MLIVDGVKLARDKLTSGTSTGKGTFETVGKGTSFVLYLYNFEWVNCNVNRSFGNKSVFTHADSEVPSDSSSGSVRNW